MKFKPFTPSMCDHISSDNIFIKLRDGSIIKAILDWRQGRGDNYFFVFELYGIEIDMDSIVEISY